MVEGYLFLPRVQGLGFWLRVIPSKGLGFRVLPSKGYRF